MGLIGLWVLGEALYRNFVTGVPSAFTMGVIGFLALIANSGYAALLFRFRRGDADMRRCGCAAAMTSPATWRCCSRQAALATGTAWPDLAVAMLMATLYLTATAQVVRHALDELRSDRVALQAD